ncbi:MAG TPA: glycosyltransferase [Ignavibacteriaceae bacterium]|nr:glycosyltransferase [Ignavibacteriaceae bacterium]
MFKILVIAYYFPPTGLSGVQRTLKFVKYMPQYNWEPTVLTTELTGYYAHDYSLLDEIKDKPVKIVRVKGKEVNSILAKKGTIKMPAEFLRKFLSRLSSTFFIPDNKKGWCTEAYKKAKELLEQEKYDLIFVTGPPFSTFTMALQLKIEFNIPLAVDYRDLWFGYHFAFYATPFHKIAIKRMEYAVLKAADFITVTNRRIKEKLMDYYKFITFNDIMILPHGYDPEDFENATPEKKQHNKMILTYSGIFYEYITPKFFLKAFKELLNERPDIASNIELHFIGFLRKENYRFIKKLGIQSFVKEHGYLSHKEAINKIMMSDVLWMMVGHGKNADTISSGKLFEYFGSKKPIIACLPDGALKSAASEYGASFLSEPYNVSAIKENILKTYTLFRLGELPTPNIEYVEKHRRDFLTELLTKEFQFLVRV